MSSLQEVVGRRVVVIEGKAGAGDQKSRQGRKVVARALNGRALLAVANSQVMWCSKGALNKGASDVLNCNAAGQLRKCGEVSCAGGGRNSMIIHGCRTWVDFWGYQVVVFFFFWLGRDMTKIKRPVSDGRTAVADADTQEKKKKKKKK